MFGIITFPKVEVSDLILINILMLFVPVNLNPWANSSSTIITTKQRIYQSDKRLFDYDKNNI